MSGNPTSSSSLASALSISVSTRKYPGLHQGMSLFPQAFTTRFDLYQIRGTAPPASRCFENRVFLPSWLWTRASRYNLIPARLSTPSIARTKSGIWQAARLGFHLPFCLVRKVYECHEFLYGISSRETRDSARSLTNTGPSSSFRWSSRSLVSPLNIS